MDSKTKEEAMPLMTLLYLWVSAMDSGMSGLGLLPDPVRDTIFPRIFRLKTSVLLIDCMKSKTAVLLDQLLIQ